MTLEIPDDLAQQIAADGRELSRAAVEALAVAGYLAERLSEAEIQRLLGFATRMEVHAFLKERGAWLHYSTDDAAKDRATALRSRTRRGAMPVSGERRVG